MDRQLSDYFDNYYEMFATEGWSQLVEDLSAELTSESLINSIQNCKTPVEFGAMQGNVNRVLSILRYPVALQAARGQAELDAQEDTGEN